MESKSPERAVDQEEEVLQQERPVVERAGGTDAFQRSDLLDTRPCQVYVEEEEKGAKAEDGGVEAVVIAAEAVEEEVAIDLEE